MSAQLAPKLTKWPFLLGDLLLLGTSYFIYTQTKGTMGWWQIAFICLCVLAGAWLAVMPFLLEYRVLVKVAEAQTLTTVAERLRNLEGLAAQISGATARWQSVQEAADKTASAAKGIAERMSGELQSFSEFMQKANESEKANLRLEVEKLRRAESEWLSVLVRMLDHVYALHLGAVRSGQPTLIEQLGHFQNACRDAARRVGLAPFTPNPSEPFDAQRHQLIEPNGELPADARITEIVATGYTFQGRLLRPALVRVAQANGDASLQQPPTELPEDRQSRLPLDSPSQPV